MDVHDAAFLFLDHQTGLFQTVKDISVRDLRANTMVLAHAAQLAKVPIFTTASEPNGPNGPLMQDLADLQGAKYIPRKGEISAWDNAEFYKAIQDSGKKTLVISGVWTSVCVTFPALQAKADGFKVYAVMDASGDYSEMANVVTQNRLTQAGVILATTNMIVGELQRSWNRPDATQWAGIYGALVTNYQSLIESYARATNQTSATPGR
jgi:nicotinamidase-related amidase